MSVPAAVRCFSPAARRSRLLLTVAAALASLAAVDRLGWGVYRSTDLTCYDGRVCLVRRVIDGQTIEVHLPDGEQPSTRVRLWAVEAPRPAMPWQSPDAAEPWAAEARAALASWIDRRLVLLELLPSQVRDDRGQVFAYVHLPDGTCVNERLIREGHVRLADHGWHPHRARYELLQETARRSHRGLWGLRRE